MTLIAGTPEYEVPNEPDASAAHLPDPQPLPDELPPVMPFNFDLLPSSLRSWIQDLASRVQFPPDSPGIASVLAHATVSYPNSRERESATLTTRSLNESVG